MNKDEPAERHLVIKESIVAIRQDFNRMTDLWAMGKYTDDEYIENLKDFLWFDESGSPWFISPENGNWYKVTDDGPLVGEPPLHLYRPTEEVSIEEIEEVVATDTSTQSTPDLFCTHCGAMLRRGASFCAGCGKPVKK